MLSRTYSCRLYLNRLHPQLYQTRKIACTWAVSSLALRKLQVQFPQPTRNMARGSKNLKRRSGRRKVTRRLVSKPYKGGFRDPTMRESFDTKLTTAQNYAKIGLEGNPNGLAQLKGSKSKQAIDSAQFVDIATIQEKLHQPGKKSVNHMREEEVRHAPCPGRTQAPTCPPSPCRLSTWSACARHTATTTRRWLWMWS